MQQRQTWQTWLSLCAPSVQPEWATLTVKELRARITERDQSNRFEFVRSFRLAKDEDEARDVLRPLGLKQLQIVADFFKWRRGGNRTELVDRLVHHRERLIHLRRISLEDLQQWAKAALNDLLKAIGKGMGWGTRKQKAIVLYQWAKECDLNYHCDTATAIHADAVKAALDQKLPVHRDVVNHFKIAAGIEQRGYVENPKTHLFEFAPSESVVFDGAPVAYGTFQRMLRETEERIAGLTRGRSSWQENESKYRSELTEGVTDERFQFITRALHILKEQYARIDGEIAAKRAELEKLLRAETFGLRV